MKSAGPSPKTQARTEMARERLIAAGERLIGEFGLEGLSLRQVSALAGTRNHSAVQYHFGDVDGLVSAIIASRSPEVEQRRGCELAEAEARGPLDTRALVDCFLRPLIDFVAADGIPHFARFTVALHRAPLGWRPLDDMMFLMPVTERMLDLLHTANPDIPAPVLWQRMRPISLMVLTYACGQTVLEGPREYRDSAIENLLDMAAAALSAPIRQSTANKIYGIVF